MAYKFQKGAFHADGLISGSSTVKAVGSLSSSGDIAVTGAVHAAQLYGGGAGITGISSDAVDVTSSTGDLAYPIVFTEGAQTAGTLGLGLNTALNYNPSDGVVSSSAKAQFVGNSIFGGTLGVSGAMTLAGGLSSSNNAQFVGSGMFNSTLAVSGAMTIAGISGSGHAEFVTGVRTAGGLAVSGSTTLAAGVSSSADARFVGNVESSGQIEASGSVLGSEFKTNDVTYGDSGITMDTDGGNLLFINNDADQQIYLKVGSDTAATSVTFINASSTPLFGVDGTGQMQAAAISGSGVLQVVGNSIFGGTLGVTGAVVAKSTVSASSTLQVVGTVNSIGAMASSGSITAGSSFIIGSADLNEADMEKLDGITNGAGAANKALVLDANADVASGLRSVTASADLRAANVHATQFYGGGAGITGITSDAVDVTASLGASLVYGIVGTQGVQSDGTLGLITTVSGASFNPLDATWGSKLRLSGNVGGYQTSDIQFGEKAGIGFKNDEGLLFQITSSEAGIDISSSQDAGIALYGGDGEQAGVGIYGSFFSVWNSDDDEVYKFAVESNDGAVSGAAGAQFVGNSIFGGALSVSGATTLSGKLSSSAAMEIVGQVDVVGSLNVTGSSVLNGGIDVNGSNFTVSTAGAVTAASTIRMSQGNSLSFNGATNTAKITNQGQNLDINAPGAIVLNAGTFVSSSDGAQFVGNSIFGGTLSVSGATTLAGNLSSSAGLQYVGAALLGSTLGVSGAVSMDGGANLKVKTYTGAASIGTAAIVHVVSGGTAALTMPLPAIGTSGRWYAVKRHNNMSGNVVVDGNGGELIDGNTSITLSTAGASVYLVDDGTQWTIL